MFQINLFSLSFLNFEDSQTKIPNYFSNQSQQNSTYFCSISKIYKKMKMTYQGLREAAASEISDFLFFSCSLSSPSFLHPSPQKAKNAAARVSFFQIFPPQISRCFPSSPSLPISPTPLKK